MFTRVNRRQRYTWIFTTLLPVLFLAPEIINVGLLFFRWDYLLLAFFLLQSAFEASVRSRTTGSLHLRVPDVRIGVLFLGFAVYQALAIESGESFLEGIKYATWPLKAIFWAIGVRTVYMRLKCSPQDVVSLIRNLTFIVFGMQVLELSSGSFRDALFDLYPVASTGRLAQLSYRARGPFNGYDVSSLFYAVAAVVLIEVHRWRSQRLGITTSAALGVSAVGALIAARLGFVLLMIYFIYVLLLRKPSVLKVSILLVAIAVGQQLLTGGELGYADDLGLLERYQEVIAAVQKGDIFLVSSVQGTFSMNELLSFEARDWLWGAGLITGTTADQLYSKYLYMYGAMGLSFWVFIHIVLTITAARGASDVNAGGYARGALLISIMFAVAHFKGGNYFFSNRLGELAVLLFMLSYSRRPVPCARGQSEFA